MEPPNVGDENLTLLIVIARLRIARTVAVTIVGLRRGVGINNTASLAFSTMLSAGLVTQPLHPASSLNSRRLAHCPFKFHN
jgi:hypothetical protein